MSDVVAVGSRKPEAGSRLKPEAGSQRKPEAGSRKSEAG
jgi:hypothetical protein